MRERFFVAFEMTQVQKGGQYFTLSTSLDMCPKSKERSIL